MERKNLMRSIGGLFIIVGAVGFASNVISDRKMVNADLNNDGRMDSFIDNNYLIKREDGSYDKCTLFAVSGTGFFKSDSCKRYYDVYGHIFEGDSK